MKKLLLVLLILPLSTFAQMTDAEVKALAKNGSEDELVLRSSEMIQQNFLYLFFSFFPPKKKERIMPSHTIIMIMCLKRVFHDAFTHGNLFLEVI